MIPSRIIIAFFMIIALFPAYIDKLFSFEIFNGFYFEIGLATITVPAYLLSLIIGVNNFLVKKADCYVFLTPMGVVIFYGGLIALTYIIPYFLKKVRRKVGNEKNGKGN